MTSLFKAGDLVYIKGSRGIGLEVSLEANSAGEGAGK